MCGNLNCPKLSKIQSNIYYAHSNNKAREKKYLILIIYFVLTSSVWWSDGPIRRREPPMRWVMLALRSPLAHSTGLVYRCSALFIYFQLTWC